MSSPARQAAAESMRGVLIAAALEQLADEGMRGLTHRRVEQRAGVSQGLVKYHFGSLDGLVEAVVEHLAQRELAVVMTVDPAQQAEALATGRVPDAVWAAARATVDALTAEPGLTRARYEVFLHASTHPELQEIIRRSRERFVTAVAEGLPGAPDPRAGARLVLALVDGLLLHQLSAPDAEVDALAPALLVAAGTAALLAPLERHPRD